MFYSIGDFTISTNKQELLLGDAPQKVEPLTLKLLTFMLENPDRVITREELLNSVWKSRYISDSTLTTSISVARHAIGDNAKEQKYIKTVSGSGYRFIAAFEQSEQDPLNLPQVNTAAKHNGSSHIEDASDFYLLPDKPSIAIMDFVDISTNKDGALLAYGLTTEINAAFARMPHFFVIARASATQLSSMKLSSKEVGQCLGVRYLAYGQLQQVASRIRITLSVVDAIQDTEIFSEHYDCSLDDIFQLQDDITSAIVTATDSAIEVAEIERAFNKSTEDLSAWENYHRGLWYIDRMALNDSEAAENFFSKAVCLDNRFARAYAGLSYTYTSRRLLNHTIIKEEDSDIVKSMDFAQRCIDYSPNEMLGYMCLGRATLHIHKVESAELFLDQAIGLCPNSSHNLSIKAQIVTRLGNDYDQANKYIDLCDRLTPYSNYDKLIIIMIRIVILINQRQYNEALIYTEQATSLNDKYFIVFALAAACHQLVGNQSKAQENTIKTLNLLPNCTVDSCQRVFSCKKEPRERLINALLDAGLPKAITSP